ncbi:L,D-transpeptidase [uncultured Paracoccus sp.]|uniref:L,D-transpeptidase n=1 Tax=uncultured Paracoccus sp. TaxID=189685 RepID=UPI0025ED6427|nr:L,D-transpeptidase [uncultured Paracoccus sp.]
MSNTNMPAFSRRSFLTSTVAVGTAAGLAAPALAQGFDDSSGIVPDTGQNAQRNISSFQMHDWRPYFSNLRNGAILADLPSRALHYWSEDETVYKLFPSSVPVSQDLTRTGRTEIIRKVEGPSWAPTPSMKERNPEWPDYVAPGDPDNPMGTHALWLSWQYYRIHGTHDTRKIGRKSSNGCIGLYNEHIKQLYDLTKIGTQVLII